MRNIKMTLLLILVSVFGFNLYSQQKSMVELPYKSWVGVYKGRNVIYVNERPYPPIMYSGTEQGQKTWLDPTRKSLLEFSEKGYEIIQTDTWFKYLLDETGTFNMPLLQKQLASIIEVNPEAKIVVRINVSAPQWWLSLHPNEICKTTNPNGDNGFGGNTAESLASEGYRDFAKMYLTEFVKELSIVPEADHIIGIHIGGGVYGEWHYYGIRNEPDKSLPMKKRFARYGVKKYGSLAKANKVWHTVFPSIDELDVPTFEQRYNVSDGDYRNPEKDQFVIDYYRCQQETTSSLVEELAKIVKETWPRPVIIGVFFGYLYGGFTVGAEAGQNDVERIFRSPYIDYFGGPYFSRDMNGSGCYRSLAASCALNGKIWFTEHDGGTFLGGSGAGTATFPNIPADEKQTIARMRRNYMYSITENGGQWWYDFGPKSQGGGWWSTPVLMREIGDLLALSKRFMEATFEKPSDVLLVYDMDGYYYMRPRVEDKISGRLIEGLADGMLGSGVAFDKIFMMDLQNVNLEQYKTIIFSNTISMDEQQRDFIKKHIFRDGKNVIFMSGAGYTDKRKNSIDLMSSLMGIQIRSFVGDENLNLKIDENEYNIPSDGIKTIFYVDDPSVKVLGYYSSGKVGAVRKKTKGYNVYYFGLPLGSDSGIYRALLNETDCRTYVDGLAERDYVSVGGGIIGVYTVRGGIKTIKPVDGSVHQVFFPPYSCFYFDLHNGTQLNE